MCYLVAKKFGDDGCLALQTDHGKHLADFEKKLLSKVDVEKIQLVVISRPSAYGEYAPYKFADTEQEFEQGVMML